MRRVLSVGVFLSFVAAGAVARPLESLESRWQRQAEVAPQQAASDADPVDQFAVIDVQLAAFNAHDVNAMVANLAEDFAWFAVDPDMTRAELRGREEFRRSMELYFTSVPGARAEIEERLGVGPFAAVRERAYWMRGGVEFSQASLAVYELRDGLIRRVWYYPLE